MPVSDILQIPVLTETQAQKTTGINMAIQALEKALTSTLEVDTSLAVTGGYNLVIPFDTTNDLSGREALRAIAYRLLAGATQEFDLIHPNNPHLFIVINETTEIATLQCATGVGTDVEVLPNATILALCDGENMVKMDFTIATLIQAYDFEFAFYGMPLDAQVLGRNFIGREVTFPANLDGIRGYVGVNPLINYVMTLWDDSEQFGTITIGVSGGFTATTTSGLPRTVAAGSILELRGAATADALLDTIGVVVPATTVVDQPFP